MQNLTSHPQSPPKESSVGYNVDNSSFQFLSCFQEWNYWCPRIFSIMEVHTGLEGMLWKVSSGFSLNKNEGMLQFKSSWKSSIKFSLSHCKFWSILKWNFRCLFLFFHARSPAISFFKSLILFDWKINIKYQLHDLATFYQKSALEVWPKIWFGHLSAWKGLACFNLVHFCSNIPHF